MNVDQWLTKCYVRETYNCLHFSAEVWAWATGEDIRDKLAGLLGAADDRALSSQHFKAFKRLAAPSSPCLVYMRALKSEPHLGVFLGTRVLHLRPQGPEYLPFQLATRGFHDFRFYQ